MAVCPYLPKWFVDCPNDASSVFRISGGGGRRVVVLGCCCWLKLNAGDGGVGGGDWLFPKMLLIAASVSSLSESRISGGGGLRVGNRAAYS